MVSNLELYRGNGGESNRGRRADEDCCGIIQVMAGPLFPLFPLELALLPHARLPLHIFEDRYKEMISECLENSSEFGVVLRREAGILRVGCSASIEKVLQRHEDGRMDILTVGRRRFNIESINTERSYLQAEVEFFQDPEFVEPEPAALARALAAHGKLAPGKLPPEAPASEPGLSFRLAAASDDQDFRQVLLSIESEAERMDRVAEHLEWLVFRQDTRSVMKKVAGSNGHGRHVKEFGEEQ